MAKRQRKSVGARLDAIEKRLKADESRVSSNNLVLLEILDLFGKAFVAIIIMIFVLKLLGINIFG